MSSKDYRSNNHTEVIRVDGSSVGTKTIDGNLTVEHDLSVDDDVTVGGLLDVTGTITGDFKFKYNPQYSRNFVSAEGNAINMSGSVIQNSTGSATFSAPIPTPTVIGRIFFSGIEQDDDAATISEVFLYFDNLNASPILNADVTVKVVSINSTLNEDIIATANITYSSSGTGRQMTIQDSSLAGSKSLYLEVSSNAASSSIEIAGFVVRYTKDGPT